MPLANYLLHTFPGRDQDPPLRSLAGKLRRISKALAFEPIFVQVLGRKPPAPLYRSRMTLFVIGSLAHPAAILIRVI